MKLVFERHLGPNMKAIRVPCRDTTNTGAEVLMAVTSILRYLSLMEAAGGFSNYLFKIAWHEEIHFITQLVFYPSTCCSGLFHTSLGLVEEIDCFCNFSMPLFCQSIRAVCASHIGLESQTFFLISLESHPSISPEIRHITHVLLSSISQRNLLGVTTE